MYVNSFAPFSHVKYINGAREKKIIVFKMQTFGVWTPWITYMIFSFEIKGFVLFCFPKYCWPDVKRQMLIL